MCGIGGIFAYHLSAPEVDRSELTQLSAKLAARGPDGAGEWFDARVGLVHRRLAIIDLNERANQPMLSASGRFALVFNGEIYNFRELRARVLAAGVKLRTESDTEVLLELLEFSGIAALDEVIGMYAFALYDRQERTLKLVRDPYGIKPLYYSDDGWTLRFASSVKALAACAIDTRIDPAAAVGFALFGSVPEPFSWLESVRQVPAGSVVCVNDQLGARSARPFFSFAQALHSASRTPLDEQPSARDAFCASVDRHLVADVPVGIFLSAGVDSGALAGLMAERASSRVCAVTLSFAEFAGSREDEAPLAASIAAHYGLEHHVARISETEFSDDLDAALRAMDQPSIDGFNTYWVSKAARKQGLKVAISGLGGDELLGGYPSFRDIPRWHRWLNLPAKVPLLGKVARVVSYPILKSKHPKLAGMLELGGSWAGLYQLKRGLFMPWELSQLLPQEMIRDGLERLQTQSRIEALNADVHPLQRVALLESGWYMRHQLLRDSDWASMAHGLEVRVPLVDVALFKALAPRLASLAPGAGKRLLAHAPNLALPDAIVNRPKTGFQTPVGGWIERSERFAAVRSRFSAQLRRQHWSRRLCVALLDDAGVSVR